MTANWRSRVGNVIPLHAPRCTVSLSGHDVTRIFFFFFFFFFFFSSLVLAVTTLGGARRGSKSEESLLMKIVSASRDTRSMLLKKLLPRPTK